MSCVDKSTLNSMFRVIASSPDAEKAETAGLSVICISISYQFRLGIKERIVVTRLASELAEINNRPSL